MIVYTYFLGATSIVFCTICGTATLLVACGTVADAMAGPATSAGNGTRSCTGRLMLQHEVRPSCLKPKQAKRKASVPKRRLANTSVSSSRHKRHHDSSSSRTSLAYRTFEDLLEPAWLPWTERKDWTQRSCQILPRGRGHGP